MNANEKSHTNTYEHNNKIGIQIEIIITIRNTNIKCKYI